MSISFSRILLLFLAVMGGLTVSAQPVPDSVRTPPGERPVTDSLACDSLAADSVATPSGQMVCLDSIDLLSLPALRVAERPRPYPGGAFFLLTGTLLLLIAVRLLFFPGYTRRSWNALVNENLFFQMVREKAPVNPVLLLLELVLRVFLIAAVVLSAAGLVTGNLPFGAADLARVAGAFTVFLLVKSAASFFVAVLTGQEEHYRVQFFSNLVIYANAAWLLVPAMLVSAYLPHPFGRYAAYAVAGLFLLVVAALVFRALRVVSKIGAPLSMHFFLYLCAFEILPYLFVARIVETRLT